MTPTVDVDAAKARLKTAFVDFAGALAERAFEQVLAEVTGRMMRQLADEANATLPEPPRAFDVASDMRAAIAAPRRGRKPGAKANAPAKADGRGHPDTDQDAEFRADWLGGIATKKLVKKYKRSPYKLRKWADRLGLDARPRGFSGIEARAKAASSAPRPAAATPVVALRRSGEDRPVFDSGITRVQAGRENSPALSGRPSPVTETLPAAAEILDVTPDTIVRFLKSRDIPVKPNGSSMWDIGTGPVARRVERHGLLQKANEVRLAMGKPAFRYVQGGAGF
jgi:hypothetical protein